MFYISRALPDRSTFDCTPVPWFNPITCQAKWELRGLSSLHTESLRLLIHRDTLRATLILAHSLVVLRLVFCHRVSCWDCKIKKTINISNRIGCGRRGDDDERRLVEQHNPEMGKSVRFCHCSTVVANINISQQWDENRPGAWLKVN